MNSVNWSNSFVRYIIVIWSVSGVCLFEKWQTFIKLDQSDPYNKDQWKIPFLSGYSPKALPTSRNCYLDIPWTTVYQIECIFRWPYQYQSTCYSNLFLHVVVILSTYGIHVMKIITVTLYWARWRLKSPAPRLFTQPFYSDADQRKYQSSALTASRWLVVNSPHKGPVSRKIFPFDDVIMWWAVFIWISVKVQFMNFREVSGNTSLLVQVQIMTWYRWRIRLIPKLVVNV